MPARLRRIIAVAEQYGVTVEPPKGGSHWKAKKPGFRTYPIPAHRGDETMIGDVYIRGSRRNFAIDRDEFLARL